MEETETKQYFIYTCSKIELDKLGFLTTGYHSTVGYVPTLEEAIDIVEHNTCDLYENGLYKYVIIKAIEPGLYKFDFEPIVYQWVGSVEEGCYKRIERPEAIVCLSL